MRWLARVFIAAFTLAGCAHDREGGPTLHGTAGSGGETELEPEQCTATLRIESLEERPDTAGSDVAIPFSAVTAVRHCERSGTSELAVGEERGICTRAAAGSAIARVSCWWAGATSEIVLVRDEQALVVRRVETSGERVRGDVASLGALGLPENSRLVALENAGD